MSSVYMFICAKTTADTVIPARSGNQVDFNRRVANAFKANAGGHLTVGDLKARPIGTAVQNHLLCDGSAVSRTAFPELFALLGETEGPGDGTTTFNLPNYLGAPLEVPPTAPEQTVTDHGTVEDSTPVVEPTEAGQTGGTEGGNVVSGGRVTRGLLGPLAEA